MKRPRKPRKPGSSFGGRTTRMHAPDFGELEFDANGYAYPDMGAFATQPLHKRNVMLARLVPVTIAYDALRLNIERAETMKLAGQMITMNGEKIAAEIQARKAAEEAAGEKPGPGPVAVPDEKPAASGFGPLRPEGAPELAAETNADMYAPGPRPPRESFLRRLGRKIFGDVKFETGEAVGHNHVGYYFREIPRDPLERPVHETATEEQLEVLGPPPIEPIVWLEDVGDWFRKHNHAGVRDGCQCPTIPKSNSEAPRAEN